MKFGAETLQFRHRLSKYDTVIGKVSSMIKVPGGRSWPDRLHLTKTSPIDVFERVGEIARRMDEVTLPRLQAGRGKVVAKIGGVIDLRLEGIRQLVEANYLPKWSLAALNREKLLEHATRNTRDVSESDVPNTTRRFELPNKRIIEVRDGVSLVVIRTLMPTLVGNPMSRTDFLGTVHTELSLASTKDSRRSIDQGVHEIDERLKLLGYEIARRRVFSDLNPKEVYYQISEYDPSKPLKSVDDLKAELGNDPRIAKLVDDNHVFRNLRAILRERPDLWPTNLVQNGFRWDEPAFKRLIAFFREELKIPQVRVDPKPDLGVRVPIPAINNGEVGIEPRRRGRPSSGIRSGERTPSAATSYRSTIADTKDPWGRANDDGSGEEGVSASPPSGVNDRSVLIWKALGSNLEGMMEGKRKDVINDLTLRLLTKFRVDGKLNSSFSALDFIKEVCRGRLQIGEFIGVKEGDEEVFVESAENFLSRVFLEKISEAMQTENPGITERKVAEAFRAIQSKWSIPKIEDYLCRVFGLDRQSFKVYLDKDAVNV